MFLIHIEVIIGLKAKDTFFMSPPLYINEFLNFCNTRSSNLEENSLFKLINLSKNQKSLTVSVNQHLMP